MGKCSARVSVCLSVGGVHQQGTTHPLLITIHGGNWGESAVWCVFLVLHSVCVFLLMDGDAVEGLYCLGLGLIL